MVSITLSSTRAEPLSFRAMKDLAPPQKNDYQECTLMIIFLGCQLA